MTKNMKATLLQIGYGVFAKEDGYYDETNMPIDLRSANALLKRELIYYSTNNKGAQLCGMLNLTILGEAEFEREVNQSRI